MDFIKKSLPSPVLQAFANPMLRDFNIKEAENLLRTFLANFQKDSKPYKLLRRGYK